MEQNNWWKNSKKTKTYPPP